MVEEASFRTGDGLAVFHPGTIGLNVGFGGAREGLDDSGVGEKCIVLHLCQYLGLK